MMEKYYFPWKFFLEEGQSIKTSQKIIIYVVFYKTNTDSNFLELIMLISAETMW